MFTLVSLLIAFLLLTLAVSLLYRGFRGIRVDDHPICKRCGFDLYGSPITAKVCSECGGSLTQRESVTIGHHQRQKRLIIAGFATAVPLVMLITAIAWNQFGHLNWLDYAPTRLVTWLATSANLATRSPAFAELNARLTAGTLSKSELERIADIGLDAQADMSKPWDGAWGDWIENSNSIGELSDDRWKRYLKQAIAGAFTFNLRPRVRRGDPLAYTIATHSTRVAKSSRLWAHAKGLELTWIGPNGPTKVRGGIGGTGCSLGSLGVGSSGSSINYKDFPEGLSDGIQHLTEHIEVEVSYATPMLPMITQELNLDASFNLLPSDQATVREINSPELKIVIEKSLSAQCMASNWPNITVQVNGPPVGLSFDVYVRSAGKEFNAGSLACPAGTSHAGFGMRVSGLSTIPKSVEIILRSNIDAALNTLDTFEMWQGEIVLKDVPVK